MLDFFLIYLQYTSPQVVSLPRQIMPWQDSEVEQTGSFPLLQAPLVSSDTDLLRGRHSTSRSCRCHTSALAHFRVSQHRIKHNK